jgi:hypothetical protein
VIEQRGSVGGIGDQIRFAGEQRRELVGEIAIELRFACGHLNAFLCGTNGGLAAVPPISLIGATTCGSQCCSA